MSGIMLMGFSAMMGSGATYTLTGETISNAAFLNVVSGLRVNTDGTIDRNDDTVYSQMSPSTDWVIPNSESSNDHWVRFQRVSGDTSDFIGTLNTWLKCSGTGSSNREIYYSAAGALRSGVYTVNIATDASGTNIVAGDNYTITADAT